MSPTADAIALSPHEAEQSLRAAGLRVTAQRVAALRAIAVHPHASIDALHPAIREHLPAIALPTVHAVVSDLTASGLVRRVSLPDSGHALYELSAPADNHHHLQCVSCGRVEDVPCTIGHAPCLTPSDDHGMRVLEAAVTFRAVCRECERNSVD